MYYVYLFEGWRVPPDPARIQAILNFVMHWRDVMSIRFKFWFEVPQYNEGTKIRREVTQTRMVSWSRLYSKLESEHKNKTTTKKRQVFVVWRGAWWGAFGWG